MACPIVPPVPVCPGLPYLYCTPRIFCGWFNFVEIVVPLKCENNFAINIGMTIGLLPVIGIPLPFFSYGGSSLWAFTILLFIFLRLDASRMELLK